MAPAELKRQECIIYSRCCGWFSPTKAWNNGKAQEFKDRKEYKIKEDNL